MGEKLRNIIEDITSDLLNNTLILRYDICTCQACKNDMLAYVLSRIPAKYVTSEKGAVHMLIEQSKVEHQAEITREILNAIDLIGNNPRHETIENRGQSFDLLLDKIHLDRGLDFRHYRKEILKRRLSLRIRTNNLNSYSEYLRLLIKNPEEYDRLFEVLCINVSEFFRDPEVWITVKYLLESLIRQKIRANDRNLRIWSAGCASGEEGYSIAILLKGLLKDEIRNFSLKIHCTDVDKKCMKDMLKGEYDKNNLKSVDKTYMEKYFVAVKDNTYKLKDEIKNMVEQQYLDLTSVDFIKETDIVFCRNVFIYFSRSLQEQILMKFYNSLKPKGYLVLGKAESILSEAKEIFDEVDINARIYQKK